MKNKLLGIAIIISALAVGAFGFAACNGNNKRHEHSWETEVIAPTCTEQGYTLHTCDCGESYKDTYVDAKEHTAVVDKAVAPTCTKKGKSEGKHCSVCSTVLVAQTEIEANGHTFTQEKAEDIYLKSAATCKEKATYYKSCSVCGEVGTETFEHGKLSNHIYENEKCIVCEASKGLIYTLNQDGQSYSVKSIGECKNPNLIIPETYEGKPVSAIENAAFDSCIELKSIIIPDSVKDIGEYAFYGCSGLKSVTLSNSVTSIDFNAFNGCCGLTNITLPDSVVFIDSEAFRDCSGLTGIIIPDGVTKIGIYAFSGCSGLTSITVDSNNKTYHSEGNCLIKTESKTLILGCKNSTIPADGSVKYIDSYSFDGCKELSSITIPSHVTEIGYNAFRDCVGLKSITISNGVTYIANNAFNGCSGLTSITIPNSVTYLGWYAFNGCSSLTSVTIPDSVKEIGAYMFTGCNKLTNVEFNDTMARWRYLSNYNYHWDEETNDYTVHCIDGKLDKYGREITE